MLTSPIITQLRLRNQQILRTKFNTPHEVVAWHGAMQAQDYNHAKWAVGVRLPATTDEAIEEALSAGTIVRTHIMRPTWHLVAAADIRWMTALSAPHLNAQSVARHRDLGMDAAMVRRSNEVIVKALEGNRHLTRTELATTLEQAGIAVNSSRMVHIMFSAELNCLVCNGIRRGKEQTYALLDERIPAGQLPTREEALAELARRYFQSHAPATLPDFTWWSGLRAGDARLGLEMIKPELQSLSLDDRQYWLPKDSEIPAGIEPSVFLLPAFDEFMVSYKERGASLDPAIAAQAITGNGIFKPIIVVNGRAEGVWGRTEKKTTVELKKHLFTPLNAYQEEQLRQAAERYGQFLGKKAVLG